MTERGGRPIDDDALTENFERLARLSDGRAPTMVELQGRVVRRRQRRQRQRLGAFAAMVLVVAAGAVLLRSPSDDSSRVTSEEGTTTSAVPNVVNVLTVDALPEGVKPWRCDWSHAEPEVSDQDLLLCRLKNPTASVITEIQFSVSVGGATAEFTAAWDAGDASAAARVSDRSPAPDAAQFLSLGDTTVLDLAEGGAAATDLRSYLAFPLGADLVVLSASNVRLADVEALVHQINKAPADPVLARVLAALPAGSAALLQGSWPLWLQPEEFQPATGSPFGTQTWGALLTVGPPADTDETLQVTLTTGIDANALLDDLLAVSDDQYTAIDVDGRRGILAPAGGFSRSLVPSYGRAPQVLVAADSDTLVWAWLKGESAGPTVDELLRDVVAAAIGDR